MGKYDTCISFPVSANPKRSFFSAAILVVSAPLLYLYAKSELGTELWAEAGKRTSTLLMIAYLGFRGVLFLLAGLLQICLAPNEIAVTLFGMPVRTYPAEQLGLICADRWIFSTKGARHYVEYLGICFFTPEQAATVQEERQQKNPFTRGDILFEKRNANWREQYTKKYMKRRIRREGWFALRSDAIWCQWEPERYYLLKGVYKNVPWMDLTYEQYFDKNL